MTRNLLIQSWPHRSHTSVYVEKDKLVVGVSYGNEGVRQAYSLKDLEPRHDLGFYCPFFRELRGERGKLLNGFSPSLVNVYANSFVTKRRRQFSENIGFVSPVTILQVSKHFNFEEMCFFVKRHPEFDVQTNLEFEAELPNYQSSLSDSRWPQLELVGDDRLDIMKMGRFLVRCLNYPEQEFDYYIEATAGYLPKRRITGKGDCHFHLMPLGLSPGDQIKLKVGFRFVSGLVEKIVEVV